MEAGGTGPRPAHFRPSLRKTFLRPEDFGGVLGFYSGFEADFVMAVLICCVFQLFCRCVCTLQGVAKA